MVDLSLLGVQIRTHITHVMPCDPLLQDFGVAAKDTTEQGLAAPHLLGQGYALLDVRIPSRAHGLPAAAPFVLMLLIPHCWCIFQRLAQISNVCMQVTRSLGVQAIFSLLGLSRCAPSCDVGASAYRGRVRRTGCQRKRGEAAVAPWAQSEARKRLVCGRVPSLGSCVDALQLALPCQHLSFAMLVQRDEPHTRQAFIATWADV